MAAFLSISTMANAILNNVTFGTGTGQKRPLSFSL